MMEPMHLHQMINNRKCEFKALDLAGIDNTYILGINDPEMVEQETCLFFPDVLTGDQYMEILHQQVQKNIHLRREMPIVRFADGEYAFYANNLNCNGLYNQAESVSSIKKAIPRHVEALKKLATSGKFAPLIYPGNVRRKKKGVLNFFRKMKGDNSAVKFVDFLFDHKIELTRDNYTPFYVVYAYLASKYFGELVNGKKICIISSECNLDACNQWFAPFESMPKIIFVKIPDSYVATRWEVIKEEIIPQVPIDTNICLVGAGVGSLLVCVDVAKQLSIPTIDAGHVLNMMNAREDKSNGPRLYTIYKRIYD